jgi:phospholipid/cholesterol/gamma-HCH transport system substrate-binding protein
MEVYRSEIRSGILIVLSAVILAVGVFLVSDIRTLWEEKRAVVLLFRYADGISKGSPVWYAGLEVGEVTEVRIAREKADRIAVTVRIAPEARIRKDSRAFIRNLGMMGAKYVEISPGSAGAPELQPGEPLEGDTPASLSEIIETGQQIAQQLQGTIQEVAGLVRDIRGNAPIQETVQGAHALMADIRQRTSELGPILAKLDGLLGVSRDALEGVAGGLRETTKNLNRTAVAGGAELVALLRELRETNRGLQERMARIEGQIAPVLAQAGKGIEEAGGLVRDARSVLDENDQNLHLLILQLQETSRHLQGLSEDLRAHPWKVIWKGDGAADDGKRRAQEEWRAKARMGRHGKE